MPNEQSIRIPSVFQDLTDPDTNNLAAQVQSTNVQTTEILAGMIVVFSTLAIAFYYIP